MLKPKTELCVLHVAGMEDGRALETLLLSTQIVAAQGVAQVLVALDAGRADAITWPAAFAAEVKRLHCAGLSVLGRIRALEAELATLLRDKTPCAVHFHGLAACLLGSRAVRALQLQGRVLFSPHLARLGSTWRGAFLARLLGKQPLPLHYAALATSLNEAQALSRLLNRSAEVLPYPVGEVFFAVAPQEARRPRILAHGFGAEALDLVTRLCVLLNGREARVPFSWLGRPERAAGAQLEAAGIPLVETADDLERAQALSRASAFIHVSMREDFPLAVAQAMAAGLPCLVSDTPAHRAVIRHGETGFVCTSERDFVDRLVLLLRDRGERARLGDNARAEAQQRFTLQHFEGALLRAYGLSAKRLRPARAVPAFHYG